MLDSAVSCPGRGDTARTSARVSTDRRRISGRSVESATGPDGWIADELNLGDDRLMSRVAMLQSLESLSQRKAKR